MKSKSGKYSNYITGNSNTSISLLGPSTKDSNRLENILILQGGGSLGALIIIVASSFALPFQLLNGSPSITSVPLTTFQLFGYVYGEEEQSSEEDAYLKFAHFAPF
jgi:hypothetical protein